MSDLLNNAACARCDDSGYIRDDDGEDSLCPDCTGPLLERLDNPEPLSDAAAERIIGSICRAQEEIARIRSQAAAMTAERQARLDWLLTAEEERLRLWLAAKLRGKRRSVDTLQGRIGLRKRAARFTMEDMRAAWEWLEAQRPDLIVTTRTFDVAALGKPAEWSAPDPETGETVYAPPPGCIVIPESDRLYVTVAAARKGGESEGEDG